MIVFGRSKVKAKDGAFSRRIVARRGGTGFSTADALAAKRWQKRWRAAGGLAVALHQI
ncbi:hypothetical protein [Paraburkholderia diazotrophica]|uniref:hypothetical protein n=1 Tax=Paraburkholderia diazotrophica TaxID=667676 RepID=UPI00317379C5